jgi:hypothetical protein
LVTLRGIGGSGLCNADQCAGMNGVYAVNRAVYVGIYGETVPCAWGYRHDDLYCGVQRLYLSLRSNSTWYIDVIARGGSFHCWQLSVEYMPDCTQFDDQDLPWERYISGDSTCPWTDTDETVPLVKYVS